MYSECWRANQTSLLPDDGFSVQRSIFSFIVTLYHYARSYSVVLAVHTTSLSQGRVSQMIKVLRTSHYFPWSFGQKSIFVSEDEDDCKVNDLVYCLLFYYYLIKMANSPEDSLVKSCWRGSVANKYHNLLERLKFLLFLNWRTVTVRVT